jgi:hypothetical protein
MPWEYCPALFFGRVRELYALEHFVDAVGPDVNEVREHTQVFSAGQAGIDRRRFDQRPNLADNFLAMLGQVASEDGDLAAVRPNQPEQQADRSCLASAVRCLSSKSRASQKQQLTGI